MTTDRRLAALFGMMRIRRVEEEIAWRYPEGEMRCPTHLSVGQEAVAVGVGQALRRSDLAVSGHRAHAHYLAKGGDLTAMVAEIYGRETGCARGRGGSMHLVDEAAGFMGSTAIVGGTISVGVGLALGMKLAGSDQVSSIFLGDAATETGAFYESASFAALKRLPVLFVCENNLYSVYTPLARRQPFGRRIHELAAAIGLAARACNGNDVDAVFEAANDAVTAIRAGGGPQFLEFATYRWLEHCGPNYDNDIGYRTEAEFQAWKARDPVALHRDRLLADGSLDAKRIEAAERALADEVDAAFAAARAAPFPLADTASSYLFSAV
jgi:pyruvate dehydrogenase E1 component alpha subunit